MVSFAWSRLVRQACTSLVGRTSDLRARARSRAWGRARRRSPQATGYVAACVELLEQRDLLSAGPLADTTPSTIINATAGTSTGNIVLATFTESSQFITFDETNGTDTQVVGTDGKTFVGFFNAANHAGFSGFAYNASNPTPFTILNVPGASATNAVAVSGNFIVGNCNKGGSRAFLYDISAGAYTILAPVATTPPPFTVATAISGNTVAGYSIDSSGQSHGFLYDIPSEKYTDLDQYLDNSFIEGQPLVMTSSATSVSGNIVCGWYTDSAGTHGFWIDLKGGGGATLNGPFPSSGAVSVAATGVSGDNVCGYQIDSTGARHGFIFNLPAGTYATLDVPGGQNTIPTGISGNNVTGNYEHPGDDNGHGFIYNILTDAFTLLDAPDLSAPQFLVSQGISGNTVVGDYGTNSDAAGGQHGFVFLAATDPAAFTLNVDWGGSTTGTPVVSLDLVSQSAGGSNWEVVGSATYASAGFHTPTILLVDNSYHGNGAPPDKLSIHSTNIQVANAVAVPNGVPSTAPAFAGEYSVDNDMGPLTLASITQNGDQLTLVSGATTTTATIIVTPSQVLMGNAVVGTYQDSSITFTAGPFAGQTWTKLDLAANYTNPRGAATHVIQTGTSLTFVNCLGQQSPGYWISPTQVFATAWNESATIVPGELIWQDGWNWNYNLMLQGTKNGAGTTTIAAAPGQIYETDYVNNFGIPVHLIQIGMTTVIFVDATGHMSLGTVNNALQATTPYFPGDVATIGANAASVVWTDGTVWTITAPTTAITVTDYTNAAGIAVHFIQNGTEQVAFVDSFGRASLGKMQSPTTAFADLYPGDLATISGNTVTWQDGSVWTQTNAVPLTITLTDTNGAVSHVKLVTRTILQGLDGELLGLTAKRINNTLLWSNGDVWDNFDNDALNTLFEST